MIVNSKKKTIPIFKKVLSSYIAEARFLSFLSALQVCKMQASYYCQVSLYRVMLSSLCSSQVKSCCSFASTQPSK